MSPLDYRIMAVNVHGHVARGELDAAGEVISDLVRRVVMDTRGGTESVASLLEAQVAEIKRLRAELAKLEGGE